MPWTSGIGLFSRVVLMWFCLLLINIVYLMCEQCYSIGKLNTEKKNISCFGVKNGIIILVMPKL